MQELVIVAHQVEVHVLIQVQVVLHGFETVSVPVPFTMLLNDDNIVEEVAICANFTSSF